MREPEAIAVTVHHGEKRTTLSVAVEVRARAGGTLAGTMIPPGGTGDLALTTDNELRLRLVEGKIRDDEGTSDRTEKTDAGAATPCA